MYHVCKCTLQVISTILQLIWLKCRRSSNTISSRYLFGNLLLQHFCLWFLHSGLWCLPTELRCPLVGRPCRSSRDWAPSLRLATTSCRSSRACPQVTSFRYGATVYQRYCHQMFGTPRLAQRNSRGPHITARMSRDVGTIPYITIFVVVVG